MDDIHKIYIECGLSDLEEFQLRDQQYLESMKVAYRLSLLEVSDEEEETKNSEEEPKNSEEEPKKSEKESEEEPKKSEKEPKKSEDKQLEEPKELEEQPEKLDEHSSGRWEIYDYNDYRGSETNSLSRLATHPDPYGVLFSPVPSALCTSPPQASTGFLRDITKMVDCLNKIGKIYELIDVQDDDIFLTLADTHEIISVNQVIKEWRDFKRVN